MKNLYSQLFLFNNGKRMPSPGTNTSYLIGKIVTDVYRAELVFNISIPAATVFIPAPCP